MMIRNKELGISWTARLMIATVVFGVFPVGLVYAQDMKAIERRLGRAVEAGELTLDQAKLMLDTLRRSKQAGTESRTADATLRFEAIEKKLDDAVKAGRLSAEQAEKKLIAVRREMFGTDRERESSPEARRDRELAEQKERYEAVVGRIKRAVKAGKLNPEEPEKKLIAVRREMFGKDRERESSPEARRDRELAARKQRDELSAKSYKEIEAAVRSGKLTKEQAQQKLEALRRAAEQRAASESQARQAAMKERFAQAAREIEKLVAGGVISKLEAEKRLAELRKKMFGDQ